MAAVTSSRSPSPTATSTASTTCPSAPRPARSPACWGPTGPARPRPSRRWRACAGRRPGGCRSSGRPPPRPPGAHRADRGHAAGGRHPPGAAPPEVLRHAAALYRNPLEPRSLLERLGLTGLEAPDLPPALRRRAAPARAGPGAWSGGPRCVPRRAHRGVDPAGRQVIRQVIADLRDEGVTVLLTTHDLDEAERVADRVVIVDPGRLVAAGTSTSSELVSGERPPGSTPARCRATSGGGDPATTWWRRHRPGRRGRPRRLAGRAHLCAAAASASRTITASPPPGASPPRPVEPTTPTAGPPTSTSRRLHGLAGRARPAAAPTSGEAASGSRTTPTAHRRRHRRRRRS